MNLFSTAREGMRWVANAPRVVLQGFRWIANAPRALMGCYVALIVVCGLLYSVFEDKNIGDSMWWAVVTASTVGYGDLYPTTWSARVLAGLLISIMVLLVIPLITAHFASKLIVNNDAFQHEEQEEIKIQLREIRALTERLADELMIERRRTAEVMSARTPAADTPADVS